MTQDIQSSTARKKYALVVEISENGSFIYLVYSNDMYFPKLDVREGVFHQWVETFWMLHKSGYI